jgi:AraC-like DNA-binding protein
MQVSFLPELISLSAKGRKLLNKTSLAKFDLSHPDNHVPVNSIYEYLVSLDKDIEGTCLTKEFRNCFRVNNLGSYGSHFLNQPDLLKGFKEVEAFQEVHKSNLKIEFKLEKEGAKLVWFFIDPPTQGRDLMEKITFAQLMDAFDLACGNQWTPLEINFTSTKPESFEHLLPPGDYKINRKQPVNSLLFPTSLLLSRLEFHSNLSTPKIQSDLNSLSSKIQLLLQNSKPGRIFGLDDCSEIFNISERHLRRTLASERTSFTEIFSRVQFLKSLHFMETGKHTILEISQMLGYTNCSNFIRAFKKWTGNTPLQYKERVLVK